MSITLIYKYYLTPVKLKCYSDPNSLLVSQVRIKDSNSETSISDIASLIKNRYKDQSGTAASKTEHSKKSKYNASLRGPYAQIYKVIMRYD